MKAIDANDQGRGGDARWSSRLAAAVSSVIGGIAGLVPHVLHHIGPIAGTAILTGTEGSVLFGAIGFVLTVPLLLRLKKRFGTWLAPGIALGLFIVMFAISTLWIGPAIRGDESEQGADPHHQAVQALNRYPASLSGLDAESCRRPRPLAAKWHQDAV